MKLKISICRFLIFCFLIVSFSVYSQDKIGPYSRAYHLKTSDNPDSLLIRNWQSNNTSLLYYGLSFLAKDYLFVTVFDVMPMIKADKLRLDLEQRVLLPQNDADSITITLRCKGESIQRAMLIIKGLDEAERVVDQSFVEFCPDTVSRKVSVNISAKDVLMLDLKIKATGLDKKSAVFYANEVDVFIGERHIDSFELRRFENINSTAKITPLQGTLFATKATTGKIMAFGESIHHNSQVQRLIYDMIFDQVRNQECRLIICEMAIEKTLLFNRFISDPDFKIGETDFVSDEFKVFLEKLRAYNLTKPHSERVLLFGVDYCFESSLSLRSIKNNVFGENMAAMYLFDYITRVYSNSPYANSLALLVAKRAYRESLLYLEKHEEKLDFSDTDVKIISHILKMTGDVSDDPVDRIVIRDSIMSDNAIFLIDNFTLQDEKVALYAHAGHVNFISTYPSVACLPLGYYLKNRYSKDYVAYLVTVGRELYVQEKGVTTEPLVGSIENFMDKKDGELLYMPFLEDMDRVSLCRFQGATNSKIQFHMMNPFRRFDGAFFLKTAIKGNVDVITSLQDHTKALRVRVENKFREISIPKQ